MFRVSPNGENRIDIELSGQLDSEAMQAALDELIAAAATIEHGVMLYRIDDFKLPTLGALAVELGRMPDLFRLTGRFDRIAVVCAEAWIQRVSEFEGAFIPGLEIRAFTPGETDAAEVWLNE
tara:strand:- start:11 stop:376 length:366 start_codon:yes stop_codon:yes gene_type:complete